MARTSRTDKARTRQHILAHASRAIRRNGVAGVSIPALMKAVGLTHGTFYAHFASKEAMVAETYAERIDEVIDGLLRPAESASQRNRVDAVLDAYLNNEHRDNPAEGCFFPTMSGEVSREVSPARVEFGNALRRYFARLAAVVPNSDRTGHRDAELVLASGMAGAILLARAVDDPELSDRILSACRDFYSDIFTDSQPLPIEPKARK
jgi:TetR/AcrR family transcriptional regulator, transcriptional repressor for nem operon